MLIARSIQNKTLSRLRLIISGGVSTIIRSMGNIVVALLVVRLFSDTFWGQFVFYLMLIDLAFNFINWGHRSYLLRAFSLQPDQIVRAWQISFNSRIIFLLLAVAIIIFLPFSIYLKGAFIIWGIARYIYQSFEPINAFQRNYAISIITESAGYLIILLPILIFTASITFEILVLLYMISYILRCLIFSFYYKSFFSRGNDFAIDKKYYLKSLPFLLIGLSSILANRADLYIVALFLDASLLAQYQIFISFLLFSHFASSIILSPFEKNIYRLSDKAMRKLQKQLIFSGVFISMILILIIYLVIRYIFSFELSAFLYLAGLVYIYLFFTYQLKYFEFAKNQNQKFVTATAFAAGIVNIIAGIFLVPSFQMEGAIVSAVVAQLIIAIILNIKNSSKAA